MTAIVSGWRFQPIRASGLAAAVGVFALGAWAFIQSGIQVNPTPSMPMGLYQSAPVGHLMRGDIVDACAPKGAVLLAISRGYLERGISCPGGGVTVLKTVAAVPGNTVYVTRQGVFINGKLWPESKPLATDPKGRPLHPDYGVHYLAPGQYWLMGKNPLSWDSRYWGPVRMNHIRRSLRPIWVFSEQPNHNTTITREDHAYNG